MLLQLQEDIDALYTKRQARDLLNKHPDGDRTVLVVQLLKCTDPVVIAGVKNLLNPPQD